MIDSSSVKDHPPVSLPSAFHSEGTETSTKVPRSSSNTKPNTPPFTENSRSSSGTFINTSNTSSVRQAGPNKSSKKRYQEFHLQSLSAQKSELRALESSSLYTAAAAAVSARRLVGLSTNSTGSSTSSTTTSSTLSTTKSPSSSKTTGSTSKSTGSTTNGTHRKASSIQVSDTPQRPPTSSHSSSKSISSLQTTSSQDTSTTIRKHQPPAATASAAAAFKKKSNVSADSKEADLKKVHDSDNSEKHESSQTNASLITDNKPLAAKSTTSTISNEAPSLAAAKMSIHTVSSVTVEKSPSKILTASEKTLAMAAATVEATKEAAKIKATTGEVTKAKDSSLDTSKEAAKLSAKVVAHETPKEAKPKDAKPKDAKPKDAKPKDTKPKDQDSKPKDTKPKAVRTESGKDSKGNVTESQTKFTTSEAPSKPRSKSSEPSKLISNSPSVKDSHSLPAPKTLVVPKTASRSVSPARKDINTTHPHTSHSSAQVLSPVPRRTGALSHIPLLQHQRSSSDATTLLATKQPSNASVHRQPSPLRHNSVSPKRTTPVIMSDMSNSRTSLGVPRAKQRPLSADSLRSVTSSGSEGVYDSGAETAAIQRPQRGSSRASADGHKTKQPLTTHYQSAALANGGYIYHPQPSVSNGGSLSPGLARTTLRDKRSKTTIGFINPFNPQDPTASAATSSKKKSLDLPSTSPQPGKVTQSATMSVPLTAAKLAREKTDAYMPRSPPREARPPTGASNHHKGGFFGRVKQKLKKSGSSKGNGGDGMGDEYNSASGENGKSLEHQPVLIKTTMRKERKRSFNEDKPWKHHADAVKVTENERKRYEGMWAANRGIHIPYLYPMEDDAESEDFDDDDDEEDDTEYDEDSEYSEGDSDVESISEDSEGLKKDELKKDEPKTKQKVAVPHVDRERGSIDGTQVSSLSDTPSEAIRNTSGLNAPPGEPKRSSITTLHSVTAGPSIVPYIGSYEEDPTQSIHGIVVRDMWRRSRLGDDVLGRIWDLVDRRQDGTLDREGFLVGMWLVDQCLYGRKLPVKVDDAIWSSVGRLNVRIKIRRTKKDKEDRKAEKRHQKKLLKEQKKALHKEKHRARKEKQKHNQETTATNSGAGTATTNAAPNHTNNSNPNNNNNTNTRSMTATPPVTATTATTATTTATTTTTAHTNDTVTTNIQQSGTTSTKEGSSSEPEVSVGNTPRIKMPSIISIGKKAKKSSSTEQ